jgi:hypothetical protein
MPVLIEVSEFTSQKLFLKDYTFYATMNAKLKRYKELHRKVLRYQDEERKFENKKKLGFIITSDMVLHLINMELNQDEQYEYDDLNHDFEDLMQLDTHSLTLEQWSFFKVLYPKVNNEKLFTIISQLSREYINQLSLDSFDKEKRNGNFLLNAKYIAFCNEIAKGKIQYS